MRRLRFSLWWFLLVTTATAILLGTVGKRLYEDWQRRQSLDHQQRIANRLEASGAGVRMREGFVTETHITPNGGGAKAMSLLKGASGLERFRAACPLDDSAVSVLASHAKLRQLSIPYFSPEMSDRSLQVIGGLRELQAVSIAPGLITDDGLASLSELTELTGLDIWSSPIQGRGLIHIAGLPKLQYLSLRGSTIDDDSLAALSRCPSLIRLELDRTTTTGRGLAHLRELSRLATLNLGETRLTIGEPLADLDQVQKLDFVAAHLAPGILPHLAEMRNLRYVNPS